MISGNNQEGFWGAVGLDSNFLKPLFCPSKFVGTPVVCNIARYENGIKVSPTFLAEVIKQCVPDFQVSVELSACVLRSHVQVGEM
jgi:hypothetical protein